MTAETMMTTVTQQLQLSVVANERTTATVYATASQLEPLKKNGMSVRVLPLPQS